MAIWRPRISILTSLLLMTFVGMAIVIGRLWREVVPLRAETQLLRSETGRLSIDDPSRIHAIQVRTGDPMRWKWRVWIPEGLKVNAFANWGTVPHEGVPAKQCGVELDPGEQWVTLQVVHDASNGEHYARVETASGMNGVVIDKKDYWWEGPPRAMAAPGVGYNRTEHVDDLKEPFALYRYHIGDPSVTNASNLTKPGPPTTGFIIWLEEAK